MAKVAKPDEAGGGATDDAETLVARSRQPALGRQADRALGTLARKIRALRDETRGKGGDEQQVKDLGAALRRVRAEIVRRGEAAAEDDAGEQDQVPAPAAGAAGARAPRTPGIRAGRPGARKMPKPQSAEPAPEPAAEPVRAPKMSRAEAGALASEASPAARREGGAAPLPGRKAEAGAAREDKAEKKARKDAEKAERKRVKEAEKAEDKAARKARKDAEKAGKKAGKRPGDSSAA